MSIDVAVRLNRCGHLANEFTNVTFLLAVRTPDGRRESIYKCSGGGIIRPSATLALWSYICEKKQHVCPFL